jgi:hypothetical protein
MFPCKHCAPYGSDPPGLVPMILRPPEEWELPPELRPPAQVLWVPCTECHGAVASCCEVAELAGAGPVGSGAGLPDNVTGREEHPKGRGARKTSVT